MNLVRWNPWREMDTLSNRINRFFHDSSFPVMRFDEDSDFFNWKPVVDIYDHDDKIVLKAELPGVDKKDIHVDFKDRVLTLTGERSHEDELKEENYHKKERSYGKFSRSFVLPEGLDASKIEAEYKDGVLKIEIPKPEEKKPRKITVKNQVIWMVRQDNR